MSHEVSDIEQQMFGRVVNYAFYASRRILCLEHLHSELANSEKKIFCCGVILLPYYNLTENNKTASHYRHFVRPLTLLKISMRKMKAFSLEIRISANFDVFLDILVP